ncbi:hypothetical protein CPC08DRAFT_771510 [Agrocybe pediades]|nr:hypothetical protein CPC08DRAFT_771510 [Agrocybe pediades]
MAVIHITKYFNKIRSIFADDDRADSVSSYNSSTPSERSRMAQLSPRSVLVHLAARDDYPEGFSREDLATRNKLLSEENLRGKLVPSSQPFVYRAHTPSILPHPRRETSSTDANVDSISAYLSQRSQSATPRSDIPVPNSISALPTSHTISTLPGVSHFPDVQVNRQSGGPLLPLRGVIPLSPDEATNTTSQMITVPTNNGWMSYQYKSTPALTIPVENNSLPSGRNPEKDNPGPPGGPDYSGGPPGGWPRGSGDPGRPGGPPSPSDPRGGRGGDGGGGGGGNGPPTPPPVTHTGGKPNSDEDWQMNPKINLSNLPQWNGKSEVSHIVFGVVPTTFMIYSRHSA